MPIANLYCLELFELYNSISIECISKHVLRSV